MIIRTKKNKENPFSIISNKVLHNRKLSWRSMGIMAYLLSCPDDWKFYLKEVQLHAIDGENSLRSGLQELKDLGHLRIERKRDVDGTLKESEWTIIENPDDPECYFAHMEKPKHAVPVQVAPVQVASDILNTNTLRTESLSTDVIFINKNKHEQITFGDCTPDGVQENNNSFVEQGSDVGVNKSLVARINNNEIDCSEQIDYEMDDLTNNQYVVRIDNGAMDCNDFVTFGDNAPIGALNSDNIFLNEQHIAQTNNEMENYEMNNTQHVARTQIRPAGKNRINRSEVANKKQIAESYENPAIRKKNENETKKQKVNTDIPDSKKLSRKEIQFSNNFIELLKHWNNRIVQLNSSKMRKHKLEGSKLIEKTKTTLRKLIGFGADFTLFKCAIDIYFDFLEKRYKHKVFVGLYVSIDNFFKFSNFTKGKIDDSKSPIKGESSWYSIIAEIPGTNCEKLTGLLAKYGGEIKDANPELSKAFLDLFCRKTDRPKESVTPTEKAHFIKAGEYLAEFIEKYEKRIVWKNILHGTKINVAVPFFDLLNFDYQSPSYFLISKSHWEERFKPYLEQNGYLR